MTHKHNLQKQPPKGVPRKRCSENIQQIYRRTSMPRCDFNKVACVISIKLQSNFIEIAPRHGGSPVSLLHIFRIPFLKNTSGWLLLNLYFAMIFEKEELHHRSRQVALYRQFCTNSINVWTIFYLLMIQNLIPGTVFF